MLLLYFSKLKLLAGSATTNSPAHHSLACGIKHSKQRFVYLNSYILLHEYFEHAILFSLQVTPLPVTDIQFVNPKHASKRKIYVNNSSNITFKCINVTFHMSLGCKLQIAQHTISILSIVA